jgi:hypothetical protein
MEKEFIPYEQALALKELGFDEPCMGYRDGSGHVMIKETPHCVISAPTFSQAFRFFREEYELSCYIELTDNSRHYYYDFTISDSKNRDYNDEDCFDSCKRIYDDGKFGKYEEAELECLKKLIEIVKE